MEEGKRYYRLGMFVIVCVTLLVAVLFLLGGRSLFKPTFTFETYFNESVAGLDIGAPVRFRGVPLGQVSEILTSSATYEQDLPLGERHQYIVVRVKIDASAQEEEQMKQDAADLVKRGLRAQTALAGITGQQYLALDFVDATKYPPLEVDWTPKYTYVPSAPSLSGEIVANAQAFLVKLNDIDINALVQTVNTLAADVQRKVNELQVAELSSDTHDALKKANETLAHVDRILATTPIEETMRRIDSAVGRVDALLADPALKQSIDNAVKNIGDATERLDALVGDNQYDIRVAVQDLRVTAENLRTLSENVKRYPAGALIGGPPDKVAIPGAKP